MSEQIEVSMALEPAQALALAHFVTRVRWTEVRQNATSDDETDLMMDAMGILAKALQEAGYAPR